MATLLKGNPRHHGPIRDGQCTPCHIAHASQYFARLIKDYPKSFYVSFDTKAYALCFECHVEKLVTDEQGIGATGFRDKERNLHFVHVNKEIRGRSCRACHEVHASSRPFHIRETTPFGSHGWKIEINHTALPTGGMCSPGCHEARAYDRGEDELPKPPRAGLKPDQLELLERDR